MMLLSPVWLLGVVPWLALTAWLLLGQRRREPVPFLPLWQGAVVSRKVRRAVHRPPVFVVLILGALLLAILGAARPILPFRTPDGEREITIVVDCGATLSAHESNAPRFAALADSVRQRLLEDFGDVPVELIEIPRGVRYRTDLAHWADLVRTLSPTGLETSGMIRATAASLLAERRGPVIVLSDHLTGLADDRLVEIPPAGIDHVGIVRLAARDGAHPQVMLTVRNQSSRTTATLRERSGAGAAEMPIGLPARGGEQDYFLDATAPLGESVDVELSPRDALAVDEKAWLARERSFARIHPRFSLPEAMRRMVEAYEQSRPPRPGSPTAAVVRDFAELPAGEPGIVFAPPSPDAPALPDVPATIMPHPVTADLHPADFAGARISMQPPTAPGWLMVVSIAGHPAVMVRPGPRPQAWVGFDSPTWGRTPAFVIFWTNVFDWVGGGVEQFLSHPLTQWQPEWQLTDSHDPSAAPGLWPGLYRGPGGEWRAFDTLDLHTDAPPATPWRERLKSVAASRPRGFPAAASLFLMALSAMALGAFFWRR